MDSQLPTDQNPPTLVVEQTSATQPPTIPEQPQKPYGKNWKKWIIIGGILIVVLLTGSAYVLSQQESKSDGTVTPTPTISQATPNPEPTTATDTKDPKTACEQKEGKWIEEYKECEGAGKGLDEKTCSELGGKFDECSSACRNDSQAQGCIEVCIQVCKFN